jgi:hypothetical protein
MLALLFLFLKLADLAAQTNKPALGGNRLSFPKIIFERVGDVIRPGLELLRPHRSAVSLAAMAHPSGVTDAGEFGCNS